MIRYKLVSHPPIREIAEKMTLPTGSPERFGSYSGQIPGVTLEDASPTDAKQLFREFLIDPSRLETIDSELGRVAITGKTFDGEFARVDVNPFLEATGLGSLEIGESEAQEVDSSHMA
jgi:hypothetical protein